MRTRRTLLNFVTSFFPWILIAILGFLKIKFFISSFGSELNGLVQVVGQVYSYITMLEMGFGAAVIYKMYKPFAENDTDKLIKIFNGSKSIYKKIAVIMFAIGLIASIVAPYVISGTLDKKLIFVVFFLFSFDYLSTYFVALPYQSLFIADQKKYKLNIINNTKTVIFKLIELVLIIVKFNYVYILIFSIIFNLINNLLVVYLAKREFPWLHNDIKEKDLSASKMTKDVFVHKISKVVYDNVDIMLLSVLPNGLLQVSIYSSYNYILSYLRQILSFVLAAPLESFGNLFAKSDKNIEEKQKIYKEFFSVSLFLGCFITIMFYISSGQFVTIWLNDNYAVSTTIICIFSFIIWTEYILKPINIITEAAGKYKETKYIALVAAILNFILSLIFGYLYGILGVISVTLFVQIVVNVIFLVKYAYKDVLQMKISSFYKAAISVTCLMFGVLLLNKGLIHFLHLYAANSYFSWFTSSALLGIINLLILFIIFYKFFFGFKQFIGRILGMRRKHEN